MLKTALFDCAINEKCCSVDGGRGICPLFSSSPRSLGPGNLPFEAKKMIMPGDQGDQIMPGGGVLGGLGAAGIDRYITFIIVDF